MQRKRTLAAEPREITKIDPTRMQQYPVPGDVIADLTDAFAFYDKENSGLITMVHFRNILQNFGFHNLSKKEIDDELKRADPEFLKKKFVDYDTVKLVIGYRYQKGGKDEEARECFHLFDKRDKNFINAQEIKYVLSNQLEFPISDQDVVDFMEVVDPNNNGNVNFRDFMKIYTS